MRYLILLGLAVSLGQSMAGPPPVSYVECDGLQGTEFTVCQSEIFTRKRLISGSNEDEYAKRAENLSAGIKYWAPNSEGDGRSGKLLETCGFKQSTCLKNCDGKGDCTQKCHMELMTCAGSSPSGVLTTSSGGGPAPAPAERPDTYIIDFDDNVAKNR